MAKELAYLKIDSLSYPVFIGPGCLTGLNLLIQPYLKSGGIYLLTDLNTRDFCLPVLTRHLPVLEGKPVFSIIPGENSKELFTLEEIWIWLMDAGASRDSLLINAGGGVVSDLGGFAAATFKRGIPYINIPTSLIGQADAAIGGKTGINISGIKNQAGLFTDPTAVFILPEFLETLPEAHIKSGFAEIIKCAALSGNGFWEKVKSVKSPDRKNLSGLISETVKFKCGVVSDDPNDRSARKMLNFGHTVGHALESISNSGVQEGILHGEAIAAGMICEAFLSREIGLPERELDEITALIKASFRLNPINERYFGEMIRIMDHDKKKTVQGIHFSLLERLGKPGSMNYTDQRKIIRSFEYFNQIVKV